MNNKGQAIEVVIVLFAAMLILIISMNIGKITGEIDRYKQGQIDCINGIIKYESVDFKGWQEIKELRNESEAD